jgi:cytochrome c
MKNLLAVLFICVSAAFTSSALANDDPAMAIAMVDKGLSYLQKNGKDALIQEVNNKHPEFIKGGIYLAIRSIDGTQLAHPVNPKLVGKNLVVLPDADGKLFRKEIIEQAKTKGKGWVDYRYNNPTTNEIEKKSTYFVRSGDVILEAGIYKGK